ncbi:MAG: DUF1206 domain-containing protein [Acidobacteria bacterium]|nr:DUF1206 domain-containing protein [Acidobacteriota bacterium]
MASTAEKSFEAAEAAVRRPFVMKAARFGFVAKGVLFIVIGALAIMLAVGLPEGRLTDASGALGVIAKQPFGRILLLAFIVGATGHAVWNILRGIADVDDAGRGWRGYITRGFAVATGVVYIALALTALEKILALRVAQAGDAQEAVVTVLLSIPVLGTVLLYLIGLGVIGAGFYECYVGFTGKYRENYRAWEISGLHLWLITILGVLAFSARAVILVMIGYFFLTAGWTGLKDSIGLDAALYALSVRSYGRVLLFAAASGLIAHGILAFYEAKYRRIC